MPPHAGRGDRGQLLSASKLYLARDDDHTLFELGFTQCWIPVFRGRERGGSIVLGREDVATVAAELRNAWTSGGFPETYFSQVARHIVAWAEAQPFILISQEDERLGDGSPFRNPDGELRIADSRYSGNWTRSH